MRTNPPLASSDSHWQSHAALLALGTFAVGTDAFVIAGVMPSIAATLRVSIGAAGQLVTVFSLAYAIATPILGALTGTWARRTALVAALVVFALGNALTAMATDFDLVLASRVIAAAGAGLYTSTATATAASLAGSANRGRAIALVMLGLTSSLVLGAPLGTAIGSLWDWRYTLWLVTALGAAAGVAIFLRLPPLREGIAATSLALRLSPLRDRQVLRVLLRTLVVFTGVYIPYTYISVVYAPLIHDRPPLLTAILLAYGVAGTTGNLLAGRLTDRLGPDRVIALGTLGLAGTLVLLPWLRDSLPLAMAAVVVSGLFSFSLTTPQQHQIISHAPPGTQSFITALYQTALYLAVSLSGALGAVALDWMDPRYLSVFACAFVAASLLLRRRAG